MPETEQIMRLTFTVEAPAHKQKLGDFLCDKLPQLSKMYIRELIRDGHVEVNGSQENRGYRVRPADFVEVAFDPTRGTSMRPEALDLDIVFEDAHLIVVNKPTGMLVHPSHREKTGTLLNALTHHLNSSLITHNSSLIRPGLVHRLDKNTSGLIVVAKTSAAHKHLSRSFMRKQVKKLYIARVEGIVEQDAGTIEAPIGRHADQKQWSVHPTGKHSTTNYRVVERRADTTLLELEPVTGRTNQLRIHCQAIGHPILGDQQRSIRKHSRLCLHAQKLAFPHPATGQIIQFESPIPHGFTAG